MVSQPEGDVCGEVVAQAHNDGCNQSVLLGTLKGKTSTLSKSMPQLCSAKMLHADQLFK